MTSFEPSSAGWRQRTLNGLIQTIGPLWTKQDNGEWLYGLLTDDRHTNPAGLIHGGTLTTLLDHAFSAIAWEAAGRLPCVTIQLDSHFIAGVKPGSFVVARSRVTRKSASLVFIQGGLFVEDEEVATGNAILKLIQGYK